MPGSRLTTRLLLAVVVVYAALVVLTLTHSYSAAGGLLVLHVLAFVSLPLLAKLVRHEEDRLVAKLIPIAFSLKLAMTVVQYLVTTRFYGGGDALGYHERGRLVAHAIRSSEPILIRDIPGSGFIDLLTGVIYSVTGATILGGYLVFSWIGFWGLYLFYRAFRIALPEANSQRYAALVLLMPSLLFWPSVIGKDAWMTFALGLSAYGASRLLTAKARAFPYLVVGLSSAVFVRPHVALLMVMSLGLLYVISPRRRRSAVTPILKACGVTVLVGLSAVSLVQFQSLTGIESGGRQLLSESLTTVAENTRLGGSAYVDAGGRTFKDVPYATVSVLFRPWPFEARNPMMALAAAEGMLMLVLFGQARHVLRRPLRHLRRQPYAGFALAYTLLFCLAFSNVGNFGLLVRQRAQLLPMAFVLVSLIPRRPAGEHSHLPGSGYRYQTATVSTGLPD